MEAIATSTKIKSNNRQAFNTQALFDSARVARTVVQLRRSQQAYIQGEPATSVMYIQEGKVKLSVVNEVGKEAIVAILGPTDFFGEVCLTGQKICLATATALTLTTV